MLRRCFKTLSKKWHYTMAASSINGEGKFQTEPESQGDRNPTLLLQPFVLSLANSELPGYSGRGGRFRIPALLLHKVCTIEAASRRPISVIRRTPVASEPARPYKMNLPCHKNIP
jgi:hypothetical protein